MGVLGICIAQKTGGKEERKKERKRRQCQPLAELNEDGSP